MQTICTRAEHFRFGPIFDQNKQPNHFIFFSFWTEPKTGSNRLILVRFGLFPFQTGSNRTAMPRCHPVRINNVVLVVTTSCKGKNNCKKTVSILSNHCFDFSGHSSASRPEIIPLWQSRWDMLKAVTHEGELSKSMEESSAIHLWHGKFERWEMRDRKHGRLEEKKTNFTQILKGNIKVLPVIFTFPSRWEMRDKESIGAVNEGTLQCESIQVLKQGRGRLCAREKNDKVRFFRLIFFCFLT